MRYSVAVGHYQLVRRRCFTYDASAVGAVSAQGNVDYATAATTLALLGGVMLIGLGLIKFGFVANFLSHLWYPDLSLPPVSSLRWGNWAVNGRLNTGRHPAPSFGRSGGSQARRPWTDNASRRLRRRFFTVCALQARGFAR